MDPAEKGEAWTGPQLAAQLAALKGVAPDAERYVLFRATLRADGREQRRYEVAEPVHAVPERDWPNWLRSHGLAGSAQLRIAVLVIRETLDLSGRIVECALERRRGAVDGPFVGNPAMVEFIGAVRLLRVYRAEQNGRLQEIAPSPHVPPARPQGVEPFAGEQAVLDHRFGPDTRVLDMREPTLFEDMAGLSTIAHLRLSTGQELACGIGWHGTTPFVLVADFPRFAAPLELPPPDEAAVQQALRLHQLVRYETRLDEQGLAVLARQRGGTALFLLRCHGGQVAVERHSPGGLDDAAEDQQRWLRYAEAHEGLTPLDHYRDGSSDNLIVLTGDSAGHAWRHLIDPDGVELWRRPADDTAAAAMHQESLAPGRLALTDSVAARAAERVLFSDDEQTAPADSLLAASLAVADARAGLSAAEAAARDGDSATPSALAHLHTVQQACEAVGADYTATQLTVLLAEAETSGSDPARLLSELTRLERALREELGLLRLLLLQPAQWRRLHQTAPFGPEVEARFPACADDIEEAARCLALRRPTAAVFHCMRVLDRALRAFARFVGAAEPATGAGWEAVMGGLRRASTVNLAAAMAALSRLRRRWRAPGLMPADKYTETEAELVFQALTMFMRELAARCDEQGHAVGG